jgi:hypothetical protein
MAINKLQRESPETFRPYFVMAKRALILLFFLCLPFMSGCGGPTPREIGEIELMISLSMVILSWPVIVLLARLAKRLNFVKNIVFSIQYAILVILCFVIIASLHIYYYDEALTIVGFGAIVSIPYLLLSTTFLLTILPRNLLLYLPSFVLIPHLAMSALLYATDSEFLLKLQPIPSTLVFWPFTTIAIVICGGILIAQRKQDKNESMQKETDKS